MPAKWPQPNSLGTRSPAPMVSPRCHLPMLAWAVTVDSRSCGSATSAPGSPSSSVMTAAPIPWRSGYRPVRIVARVGEQTGIAQAWSKRTPRSHSAWRLGAAGGSDETP